MACFAVVVFFVFSFSVAYTLLFYMSRVGNSIIRANGSEKERLWRFSGARAAMTIPAEIGTKKR